MFTVLFVVLLAACGNSSDETSAASDNQSQTNTPSQNTNDNSSNADSTESDSTIDDTDENKNDTEDNHANDEADTSSNGSEKEESSTANATASLKEEYLQKLNDTKKEVEEIRKNPIDETTFALKKVEGDVYDEWDGLLNEVYGVLKQQLLPEEMEQLRIEQREWLDYRDQTAKEASLKYEGGTMEQYEYVRVENNLTAERCFELVEDYME